MMSSYFNRIFACMIALLLSFLATPDVAAQDSLIFGPSKIIDFGSVQLNDPQMPGISVRFKSIVDVIDRKSPRVWVCQVQWTFNFQTKRYKFEPIMTAGDCVGKPFTGPTEALQGLTKEAIAKYPESIQRPTPSDNFTVWFSPSPKPDEIFFCVMRSGQVEPANACKQITLPR